MREVICGLVIGLCVGVPVGAWFCERLRMKGEEVGSAEGGVK